MKASDGVRKISQKEAAIDFLQLVVARRIREAYSTHVANDMQHHNPWFAGDAASLEKGMEESHALNPHTVIDIKRAVEDGDLVAVHSHVRPNIDEPGFAVVHIFRFKDSRIVELWDVGQAVPGESPNKNGMF